MASSSPPVPSAHSFARRIHQPEWMDDPALDPALHRQALAGLARLNAFGRSADILWRALRPLRINKQRLRLLDLACGGGDVLISLARRARRAGLPWTFAGVDKSDVALRLAEQRAHAAGVIAEFSSCDVLAEDLPDSFDVITCSLFLHHLAEEDAVSLLRCAAAAAERQLLVSDLCRSRWNHLLTWTACHLFTRSPVVHFDGPVSIKAAFTIDEARSLAAEAGLTNAKISPRFPVRWLLQWSRP